MNRYCLLVTVAIMLVGCSGPDQDEAEYLDELILAQIRRMEPKE